MGKAGRPGKGVVPRELANADVDAAIDHCLVEASAKVAMGFVDALEKACAHIARQPTWECPDFCV